MSNFDRRIARLEQAPEATTSCPLASGDASPAIVTRHIERVSDKATERIYYRGMVIPPAILQPSKLDQP